MNKLLVIFLLTTSPLLCLGQSDLQTLYDSALSNCNVELAKQVRTLAAQEQNTRLEANSLYLMAYCYKNKDNLYEAVLNYMDALQLYRNSDSFKEVADILENLGNIYRLNGYKEMAINYYSETLNQREVLGDSVGIFRANNNLARAYMESKEYDVALKHCKLAIELAHVLNNPGLVTEGYDVQGIIFRHMEDYGQALGAYNVALEHAGNNEAKARTHNNRGYAFLKMGDVKAAQKDFNTAIQLLSKNPTTTVTALAYDNLASTYKDYNPDSAKMLYEQSFGYFEQHQLKLSSQYYDACKSLKDIAKAEGDMNQFVYYSDKIDDLAQRLLEVRTDLKNLYQQYQVEAATYKYDNQQKAQALERQLMIDRYITIALVVLVLVMAALLVTLYRKNRKITFAQETARKIYQVINS